jgi:thiamine transport system permease protein
MIFLAHIFYNYSVALRLISGYWQTLSRDVEQAATMLGASPRRVFWTVTLTSLTSGDFGRGRIGFHLLLY